MILELKYNQEQQVLHHQISNLETLKAQQVKYSLSFERKEILFFRMKWKKTNENN
jgi:hypothetical protein